MLVALKDNEVNVIKRGSSRTCSFVTNLMVKYNSYGKFVFCENGKV